MQILTLNKSVKIVLIWSRWKWWPLLVAELDKSFDFINESSRVTFNLVTFKCVEIEALGSAAASLSHPAMTQSTMYCAVKSINRWRCGCFFLSHWTLFSCNSLVKGDQYICVFWENTKLLQRSVLNFMQKLWFYVWILSGNLHTPSRLSSTSVT